MLDGLFFGTAAQGEAARLWRACRAVREEQDEDAHGHYGQQATPTTELPPGGAPQFVRQAPAVHQAQVLGCDRTPCGSRRLVRGDRRATARGEGCEGLDGSAPPRPLEAPSLVVHSAKGCPPTNARAHTRTTRTRPGQEASSRRPRSVAAPTGHQYHGGAP